MNRNRVNHPVHLILSPGTRIVTRNDSNRIGGGQLIAAGAVAVITDSPADGRHAYKVRFNDGAEAMLRLRLHKEFDEAFASTKQPERSDYNWANEFLIKARWEMETSES
jgi:hypothetical protein